MAPKEGPRRPPRRKSPTEMTKSEYASERRERRDRQSETDLEMERLRSKNRRLREAEARRRSRSSSTAGPAAPIVEPRVATRKDPENTPCHSGSS